MLWKQETDHDVHIDCLFVRTDVGITDTDCSCSRRSSGLSSSYFFYIIFSIHPVFLCLLSVSLLYTSAAVSVLLADDGIYCQCEPRSSLPPQSVSTSFFIQQSVMPRGTVSRHSSWFIFIQQSGEASRLFLFSSPIPGITGIIVRVPWSCCPQQSYIYKNCCSSLSACRTASKPIKINKLLDCKSKNDQNFLISGPNIVLKIWNRQQILCLFWISSNPILSR